MMKSSTLLLGLSAIAQSWASILPQEPLQDTAAVSSSKNHLSLTQDLIAFHKNLTEIESITYNEERVGEWLAASLKSQGYNVEKQYVERDPPRFNVLAWPGAKREARILVTSHIDTVPPFYPYEHRVEEINKTISGRGSVDAKGSVATQVIAVNKLLLSDKIHPDDVSLLYVVGEEVGGDGMRAANDLGLKPDTIIFGEPTEGKLVTGHKGNLGLNVQAKGKAAHSGYPWLGRSANEVLVKALAALMELAQDLPTSEKYGVTTINLGRIEGGVAGNVVAQDAEAKVTVRIAEGSPEEIKKAIVKAISGAVESFLHDGMKVEDVVELTFASKGYGPIDIDHDIPGFETLAVNYGTDIPWLEKTVKDQKRYLYGPGSILVAHSDHEELTEGQMQDAVDGYQKIVLHALGKEMVL